MQTSLLRYRLSLFFFKPSRGGGRNKNDRGEGGEEQRNEGDRIITTLSCKLADIDVVPVFFFLSQPGSC